jgi:hypothetical protein
MSKLQMIPQSEKDAQPLLIKPSPEELADLKERLSRNVGAFIALEDEKKEADADFNERLTELWEEIKGLRIRIREAE